MADGMWRALAMHWMFKQWSVRDRFHDLLKPFGHSDEPPPTRREPSSAPPAPDDDEESVYDAEAAARAAVTAPAEPPRAEWVPMGLRCPAGVHCDRQDECRLWHPEPGFSGRYLPPRGEEAR